MITTQSKNPKWWTADNDTTWERTKAAFKRDWEQTKHDFGAKKPDLNQGVMDTVKQATGNAPIPPSGQPSYDEAEPAYRFGYGARSFYGKQHSKWNSDLETQLKRDWEETYPDRDDTWDSDKQAIRYGWDYENRR